MISKNLFHIRRVIKKHHQWRSSCINLIASENLTSWAVREVLASDFGHRYAEGEPYYRFYNGAKFIDEVEALALNLAKKIFKAEHVNLKPVSGCQANLAVFYALTKPNDAVMALSISDGGHISYMDFGGAGIRNLKVLGLPFNPEEMNIDVDAAVKKIFEIKPKIVFLGGSVILFPQPIKEIKMAVKEVKGYVAYDGSHVLGLIAGGQFQDPLGEGADILSSSTHKTFPGPQGGIICCRKDLAEKMDKAIFPGLVSNHHLHHIAGLTIALLEMEKFGVEYAKQTIKNAKALAENLYNYGFDVVCANKGFTESHQVLINVSKFGGGKPVANLLEKANIICNKNLLPRDKPKSAENPSGIRLGTPEITRLGMKEREMEQIATFIKQTIIDREKPEVIAKKVKNFTRKFLTLKYCFQKGKKAYEYFSLY